MVLFFTVRGHIGIGKRLNDPGIAEKGFPALGVVVTGEISFVNGLFGIAA